ncbi:MAG: HupE/UreJ family protein [Hydrogenophilus thermoluteolus]|uniref:HupE/UreJ family protein n=1 Tax=Hydrogenophilus thermoluteolus TaxID=297 RepID=UPI000EED0BC5|nr:HupE/UreJ family protein [Hydrogenophilus thermoluteolus]MBW7656013.1 HupE/UreJ family protein [Hydrogenophilus thermoluteolus]HCO77414.1 urease accessory protein [Rhodocyclaceae bacterium]
MHNGKKWLGVLLWAPSLVWAHTGSHPVAGFFSGFSHPLSGIDHLLAMVAVGLWAGLVGGRATWRLPLAFVAALVAGFVTAIAGLGLPAPETGVQLSLLVLGLLLAFAVRFPEMVAIAVVALFGLFHGHVHGLEVVSPQLAVSYGAGMALMSTVLHGVGIALARVALTGRLPGEASAVRFAGVAVAAVGALLLTA